MTHLFDGILGPQQQALNTHGRRLELLSANIANADTPGYKARDIDFRAALARATEATTVAMRTDPDHLPLGSATAGQGDPLYRVPLQPSLDGNTVNTQVEKQEFAEASVRYESALDFLNRRISGLKSALRSE